MKTKKELLEFFLKNIELWDSFSTELAAQFWLPAWDRVDDDLSNLLNMIKFLEEHKNNYMLKKTADMLIVNQLENSELIPQMLDEDLISPAKFKYALFELYKFADISGLDKSWEKIRSNTSVLGIIDKVYALQPML